MLIGGEHAQANKNTRGHTGEKRLQIISIVKNYGLPPTKISLGCL